MKSKLLLSLMLILAGTAAFAANAISPGLVASDWESYANRHVVVRGITSGLQKTTDNFDYKFQYTISDKKGSLTVYTNNYVDEGQVLTVKGTVKRVDGVVCLEERPGLAIPPWIFGVGAVLLIMLIVVIIMILRMGQNENEPEIADEFCDQCGERIIFGERHRCPSRTNNQDVFFTETPVVESGTNTIGLSTARRPETVVMEAPPKAMLVLKDEHGKDSRSLNLTIGSKKIGRNPDCDFVVQEETVSGEHAKILEENGSFYIHDLDSRNGTYVNGEKVVKRVLGDSDEIRLGKSELKFVELSRRPDYIS